MSSESIATTKWYWYRITTLLIRLRRLNRCSTSKLNASQIEERQNMSSGSLWPNRRALKWPGLSQWGTGFRALTSKPASRAKGTGLRSLWRNGPKEWAIWEAGTTGSFLTSNLHVWLVIDSKPGIRLTGACENHYWQREGNVFKVSTVFFECSSCGLIRFCSWYTVVEKTYPSRHIPKNLPKPSFHLTRISWILSFLLLL